MMLIIATVLGKLFSLIADLFIILAVFHLGKFLELTRPQIPVTISPISAILILVRGVHENT